jgi:hypothetical protein
MQYFSVTKIENKIQSTTDSYAKYHLSFYYLVHCLLYIFSYPYYFSHFHIVRQPLTFKFF